MSVTIIRKNGCPEWAVIPYEDYAKMLMALEDKIDAAKVKNVLARISSGDEELIPADLVERLLTENPYRVWREYRGLSQQEIAAAAGVSPAYISQLESGERSNPPRDVVAAIAQKLGIDVDDLE